MGEKREKEPLSWNNIKSFILRDFLYICCMMICLAAILWTVHSAEIHTQETHEYYKGKMADCGCIEPEPYTKPFTFIVPLDLKNTLSETPEPP